MTEIYFNLRFLTQPLSGMQRYAHELITALDALLQTDQPFLKGARCVGLVPPGEFRQTGWKRIDIRSVGRQSGHLWEQTALPLHARSGILVSLAGTGPLVHRRHVLALHDANVFANPQFFSRRYAALHRALRPRLARRATRLITISNFSRFELAKHCQVSPDAFTIIPDSAEHILGVGTEDAILERHNLAAGAYALCVGNQSPNKNLALAQKALSRVEGKDMKLVLAGAEVAALRASRIDASDWVVPVGRVTDEELRTLYEHAAVFIFPSIYEGFGVPPLEAMTLGCPVVASNAAALPEILGDAVLFFDPENVDGCAEAVQTVFSLNQKERRRMVEKGRLHAARYSWETGAQELAKILTELI